MVNFALLLNFSTMPEEICNYSAISRILISDTQQA